MPFILFMHISFTQKEWLKIVNNDPENENCCLAFICKTTIFQASKGSFMLIEVFCIVRCHVTLLRIIATVGLRLWEALLSWSLISLIALHILLKHLTQSIITALHPIQTVSHDESKRKCVVLVFPVAEPCRRLSMVLKSNKEELKCTQKKTPGSNL